MKKLQKEKKKTQKGAENTKESPVKKGLTKTAAILTSAEANDEKPGLFHSNERTDGQFILRL